MRRRGVWAVGVTILVALTAGASWADDKDEETPPASSSRSWFRGWFGSSAKPETKPEDKPNKPDATAVERPVSPVALAETVRERELAALLRRQEVCRRLRAVAVETNDDELEQMALELDVRAWEVYTQRTNHLPGGGSPLEADDSDEASTIPEPPPAGRKRGNQEPIREANP